MWLLVPILIYTVIFLYVRHVYSHWRRRGFPAERTGLNWHFLRQVYKREFQYVEAVGEAYHNSQQQLVGIYFLFKPILLVRDINLARKILNNSFHYFNDVKWDYVRSYRKVNLLEKLAPIFSKSRLEGMFRNIEKVSTHMVKHLESNQQKQNKIEVDMQQILKTFSINVISTLVYGLDINLFADTDSIFSTYMTAFLKKRGYNSYTLHRLPKKSSLTYRLRDVIKESVEQREDQGYIRKDILQLLVKFRNGNDIGSNIKQTWHIENVFEREKLLSIKKLAQIAEDFLSMGLDTISSATIFTLYEILTETTILEKVLKEINNIKKSNDTDEEHINFSELENLSYLDMCIKETQRKYPGVPIIEHVCRKNFNVPDSRFTLKEGKTVMIPLMALQHDEKYFDEPQKYRPERFQKNTKLADKENINETNISAGLCIGQYFSNIVIKLALVQLLQNFNMQKLEMKQLELAFQPTPFIKSREGFKVKLESKMKKQMFYA
ncbi:probable cytochrome P450 310a1 [Teleopsis dalmanni]|uniref:probable cytochrome P450 310a1 n=1 Tax=Teleopsis dalmanni TaxID=139649 RepID=UPI0018CF4C09|nr:probable cytochrome P450 310a1 [Teleopsis dalmanni]